METCRLPNLYRAARSVKIVDIKFPEQINAEGLLPFLASLSVELPDGEPVVLDVSDLRRVTPAGLVALASRVMAWRRDQRSVQIVGVRSCAITGYLQRMDLFKTCGFEFPEPFVRHEASGRFVAVRQIDHRVDEMGNEMALCLAPGGEDYGHKMSGIYDLAWYVLTETANNVRQHSKGLGYAAAQVTRREGMVRLALADNGRGILKSFQDAGLNWSMEIDDGQAILRALEARISSQGQPTNEGVGLTLVSGMAKLVGGWLLIVSGRGVLRISPGTNPVLSTLANSTSFRGTLVVLAFPQKQLLEFAPLLERAKVDAGLLRQERLRTTFNS